MKKPATHRANVVDTKTGNIKKVKCRESVETWVVGPHESYYKNTGIRTGSQQPRIRLDLSSLTPIEVKHV